MPSLVSVVSSTLVLLHDRHTEPERVDIADDLRSSCDDSGEEGHLAEKNFIIRMLYKMHISLMGLLYFCFIFN